MITATRRVRVLFLNDTARNGGPGRSLYHILRFLDPSVILRSVVLPRPGVISELLTGMGGGTRVVEELHFGRNLVENPVEPWDRAMARHDLSAPLALRGVRFAGNVFRGGMGVWELAQLVEKGHYDLLYCNGTNADFAGGAVARLTGIPTIWHVRYTSIPRAVRGVHDWLAESPKVARIVCVSRASAKLFPHVNDKVKVLHNALDLEEFSRVRVVPVLRRELGLGPDTVVFGSHGRILRRKGYVEMIRAARRMVERLSTAERAKVAFVVLGDTPEDFSPDHLAECRALALSLGLRETFHFVGFRPDIKPIVADFDVAVVPSVYEDPLPRAVLESMALSKPVVAFDVGGVSEMLVDGETGSLVRPVGDDLGLAEAMLRYARDAELRARHGEAGRRRAVSHFDGMTQAQTLQGEIVRVAGLA
jgi:glycosyltransferase involved in cell wall biosynthesis